MFAELRKTDKALYETDFNLWVLATVEKLQNRDLNDLDWDNLIEEVEDLGRNSFNKVRILLRQVIIHLLLLEYWHGEYELSYRHWMEEIIAFRDDLNNNLTTTFTNKLGQELERIYDISRRVVMQKTGLPPTLFPEHCPYSLDHLRDESWYPKRSTSQ